MCAWRATLLARGAVAKDESRVTIGKRFVHSALLLVGTMVDTAGLPATEPGSTAAPGKLVPLHVIEDGVPEPIPPHPATPPGDGVDPLARRGKLPAMPRDIRSGDPLFGQSRTVLGRRRAQAFRGGLRLRVADNLRLNAATIMPSYYRIDGLDRVAREDRGEPILTGQQIEDVIANLATLK